MIIDKNICSFDGKYCKENYHLIDQCYACKIKRKFFGIEELKIKYQMNENYKNHLNQSNI
jgi:hypothetical protein